MQDNTLHHLNMDSSKLRQFLMLRELEQQQQINVNHDKLRTLDSERQPNIIFESDGFRSGDACERRGSSTASSDSGFPLSPSTPPYTKPKTPKTGEHVLHSLTTKESDEERTDDDMRVPPLPASFPPEALDRPFTPEMLGILESDFTRTNPDKTLNNNSSEDGDSETDSSDASSCDSSDESDSCNHYIVTEDTSRHSQPIENGLPFQISKLEGSVKTMRAKIRPGTVQTITTLFTNKARRIKREHKRKKRQPFIQTKTNETDHSVGNDNAVLKINEVEKPTNIYSKSTENENDSDSETSEDLSSSGSQNPTCFQEQETKNLPQFTFSAQNLEPNNISTRMKKCGAGGDNTGTNDDDDNSEGTNPAGTGDKDNLDSKDKQTISAELKRTAESSVPLDGKHEASLHTNHREVNKIGLRKTGGDTNLFQNEIEPLPVPSSEPSVSYKPDTNDNAAGFVQVNVVCDINQKNKSEADVLNVGSEVTKPVICAEDLDKDEVRDCPGVRDRQGTDCGTAGDTRESETHRSDQDEISVESTLLELQRAVERNNALLSQSLQDNSKLLNSFDEDDVSDDNVDADSVKSEDQVTDYFALHSGQVNARVSDKNSKETETPGGHRSVINSPEEREQPEETIPRGTYQVIGTGRRTETDSHTDQGDPETRSNAATCGDLSDVSISDESQLSDQIGSMDIDVKNNTSPNNSSVTDSSFSGDDTNIDRSESLGIEPVSQHHGDKYEGGSSDSSDSETKKKREKIFIHNSKVASETAADRDDWEKNMNQSDENRKTLTQRQECEDGENKVCKRKMQSFIKRNPLEQESSDACRARGPPHVTRVTTNLSTYTTPSQQVSDSDTHPSGEQQSHGVPEFYTLPGTFQTDKIVSLKELSGIARSMPDRYSGYTSSGSESSSYTGGRKVRTKTTTLRSGKDSERENVDIESNIHLKHLAETISKLNGENNDELLPEINQTVTKLPGGNLVITTLTHKIVEEEDDEKEVSHHPPVDDDRRCIVQDHKGNYYMVEDITDESQESAYYSSSLESHNTSDGQGGNQNFQGIYNLQAVGRTGIDYDTAEEVLLGLYNPGGTMQIQEIDERTGQGHYLREHYHSGGQPGGQYGTMSSDSSYNRQMTSYDERDGVHRPVPQTIGSSSVKTVKHSYELEREEGERDGYRRCEAMQTSQSHADNMGVNNSNSSYMMEASSMMYPPVLPPPMIVPPPVPVCHMAVVDVTPSPPQIEETREERREIVEVKAKDVERPIYKSVALVKGPYEAPKWQKQRREFIPADIEDKKCVVLNSRATEEKHEETVEEVTTKEYYTMKMSSGGVSEDHFNDSSFMGMSSPQRFKTEKVFQVNGTAPSPVTESQYAHKYNIRNESHPLHIANDSGQSFSTKYQVRSDFDHRRDVHPTRVEARPVHTESQYAQKYNISSESHPIHIANDSNQSFSTNYQVRSDFDRRHDVHPTRVEGRPVHTEAYQRHSDGGQRDIHVVRGNILIKNTLDQDLDEYNDNINLFDQAFNMTKENPMYHSDEDIYKRFERERDQERASSQRIQDSVNNDITFETVDRFTKCKEGQCQNNPPPPPPHTHTHTHIHPLSSSYIYPSSLYTKNLIRMLEPFFQFLILTLS